MYKTLQGTSKVLIYTSGIISFAFAALGAALINDRAIYAENNDFLILIGRKGSFILGLMAGYILTSVKIIMIDRAYEKELDMDGPAGRTYSTVQYLKRFSLTGAVLLISLLLPKISFFGTFLGILSLPLAGYLVPGYEKGRTGGA